MSNFDTHKQAVSGPEQYRKLAALYRDGGIALTPWCVPTGRDIPAEVELASRIIEVSNEMVFDAEVEATAYFWKGSQSSVHSYMSALRSRFPTARFVLQMDARPTNFLPFAADWASYMDRVVSMSYWTDWRRDAGTVLAEAASQMHTLGKPYGFTYPGDATVIPATDEDVYVYRRANLSAPMVSWLKSLKDIKPDPKPQPDPVPVWTVEQGVRDLFAKSIEVDGRLADMGTAVRALNTSIGALESRLARIKEVLS